MVRPLGYVADPDGILIEFTGASAARLTLSPTTPMGQRRVWLECADNWRARGGQQCGRKRKHGIESDPAAGQPCRSGISGTRRQHETRGTAR